MTPKILTLADLSLAAREWRREGATIVLACGCFDPLHYGHVQYLERAKALGNTLVVSVASDERVREAKGFSRPRSPASHRAGVLAALVCTDTVVVCESADVVPIIDVLKPHVFVKGSEYDGRPTPALVAEVLAVHGYGGRVSYASGEIICSSTSILAGLPTFEATPAGA